MTCSGRYWSTWRATMVEPDGRSERPTLRSMDVADRVDRVRSLLARTAPGCDILLVTKPANLRWLTGFTGSNGAAAITDEGLTVATDGRYREQLGRQLTAAGVEADIVIKREVLAALTDQVPDDATVALESHHVTWAQHELISGRLGSERVVAVENLIEQEREIKDPGELDRLSTAAAIADRALATVLADLPAAVTERAIARRLETVMIDGGADDISFPTIVAAGPNSSRPHAVPSDREVTAGDLIVIDMGAKVDGYGSDMTRTFVAGSFTAETEAMYRAVEAAQAAGVDTVAAGVSTGAVDRACRRLLDERGMAEEFIHGTGHGIGLEIHETPFLGKSSPSDLRAGQVVTVEPGVYRAGVGGVRVEDSVVVTVDGCRPITRSPKSPVLDWHRRR